MSDNSFPLLPLSASDVFTLTSELNQMRNILSGFQTDNP